MRSESDMSDSSCGYGVETQACDSDLSDLFRNKRDRVLMTITKRSYMRVTTWLVNRTKEHKPGTFDNGMVTVVPDFPQMSDLYLDVGFRIGRRPIGEGETQAPRSVRGTSDRREVRDQ